MSHFGTLTVQKHKDSISSSLHLSLYACVHSTHPLPRWTQQRVGDKSERRTRIAVVVDWTKIFELVPILELVFLLQYSRSKSIRWEGDLNNTSVHLQKSKQSRWRALFSFSFGWYPFPLSLSVLYSCICSYSCLCSYGGIVATLTRTPERCVRGIEWENSAWKGESSIDDRRERNIVW